MDEQTRTKLDQYIVDLFAPEDEVLRWIPAEAARNDMPAISIRALEGRLLQFLVLTVGARKAVEIGTLAGYSGVWIARALPADGKLYTLEQSPKHARVARASFQRAGLGAKVELLEGAALVSLQKLSKSGPFDFIFIDADKTGYVNYLSWAVEHLRPGGILAGHNALRHGRIVAPETDDDRGMQAFNVALANDRCLESFIIGIGDGLAVGIKKA
jgi:caffeoyl-CoA O-methyltransferase